MPSTADYLAHMTTTMRDIQSDDPYRLTPESLFSAEKAKDIMGIPWWVSTRMQMVRSIWRATESLNFTRPFSDKLTKARYGARALSGYTADLTYGIGELLDRLSPGSTPSDKKITKWLNKNVPRYTKDGLAAELALGERSQYASGFVEKFLYPRGKTMREVRRALGPEWAHHLIGGGIKDEEVFIGEFFREMRKSASHIGDKARFATSPKVPWRDTGYIRTVTIGDILGKFGEKDRFRKLITPEKVGRILKRDGLTGVAESLDLGIKQGQKAAIGWVGMGRRGIPGVRKLSSRALDEVLASRMQQYLMNTDPAYMAARNASTMLGSITQAQMQGREYSIWGAGRGVDLPSETAATAKLDEKTMKRILRVGDRIDRRAMIRASVGMVARAATVGMVAYSVLGAAVPAVVQGMARTAARMGNTMREITRQDFGSGQVLLNSRMATERQRAIEAIQNTGMNARSLLGTEAAMYH